MPHYKYLIVGGGMAADAAVRGIRELDEEGSVGVVCEERDAPYDRPPLSKGLWKDADLDSVFRRTDELGAHLHLERRIERIDPADHHATGERGVVYTYDRLLLATGGRPVQLKDATPQVLYFRTLADFRTLRKLADADDSFVVVGGGFIGTEIAAALRGIGKDVTLLFPEDGLLRNVLPAGLSDHLTERFRAEGVDVRAGVGCASVRRSARFLLVATEEETTDTLRADGVVAGLGIVPNDEIAATAGIEVVDEEDGGGIVVDAHMRTSADDVYAAGDVAAVWCAPLGRRLRFEHEDQANATGRHAGRAMAGADEEFDHLPFLYSDVFGVAWEGVGELDPSHRVVEQWEEENERGVLYYMDGRKVRGVLLWNVRGKTKAARALVRDGESHTSSSVMGAIDAS